MYPGIVTRGVAFVVDLLIVDAVALALTIGFGIVYAAIDPGKTTIDLPEVLATAAGWLIFAAAYFVAFWVLTGATPGMRAMGIRLTGDDRERVTWWHGLCRLVGLGLSFVTLGLGFLLILVDERRRALQDRVGSTLVVRA